MWQPKHPAKEVVAILILAMIGLSITSHLTNGVMIVYAFTNRHLVAGVFD
jgi:hypothetical protein